jgi:hypothetical protein
MTAPTARRRTTQLAVTSAVLRTLHELTLLRRCAVGAVIALAMRGTGNRS